MMMMTTIIDYNSVISITAVCNRGKKTKKTTNFISLHAHDITLVIDAVIEIHNVEVFVSLSDPRVVLFVLKSDDTEYHTQQQAILVGAIIWRFYQLIVIFFFYRFAREHFFL